MRSIGQALKANPLAYVLPCHRVVSSSGKWGDIVGAQPLRKNLLRKRRNSHLNL